MIKKLGVVGVGVAAGLMAAAPFAVASESHHGGDGHGHRGHGDVRVSSERCTISGGNAEAEGRVVSESAVADALAQAPVGSNVGNIVCSDVLNENVSGNTVDVNVAGLELPELPIELPELPLP